MTTDVNIDANTDGPDTFPRQYARTQRLSLGEPRNIAVSPDGARIVFLRSRSGDDPVNCIWAVDIDSSEDGSGTVRIGPERLIVDPRVLLADADDLSPAERARRERLREGAGGITSYSHDAEIRRVVFVFGGRINVVDVETGVVMQLTGPGQAFDARLDPAGTTVAYVDGRALRAVTLPKTFVAGNVDVDPISLVDPDLNGEPDTVSWGSADFIAAEEMDRQRGFWWSPDGRRIAVCRVDESPVDTWYIADPAHPDRTPLAVRYPAAGTANAMVSLSVVAADGSQRRDLNWDQQYEYLATVRWTGPNDLLVGLQTRDQKRLAVCSIDVDQSSVSERAISESDTWVDLLPGSPAQLSDGDLVSIVHRDGVARLQVADRCITPVELNVCSIVSTAGDVITFVANEVERPEMQNVWRWKTGDDRPVPLTALDGSHSASVGGSTLVVRRTSLTQPRSITTITAGTSERVIENFAEVPLVSPRVTLLRLAHRRIPSALILPRDVGPGDRLPVLMDPYGGPHAQRVVDSTAAHCTSQWFADQGFAVVVADGRGTPGLGTDWERAVHGDLAAVVLQDQVDALQALAADGAPLDLSRVGIRGWSFGGYLAALAVLRRPDVFHAGIAGAPVTDWRLYDTHYTERYLGHPNENPGPYDATSLLLDAPKLSRPLLLVHGLADDNVVAAHTLQFSSALLAAGKPHEVLPLSGVSHMTPQAVVAENLLLHQLDFLRRSLGLAADVQGRRAST